MTSLRLSKETGLISVQYPTFWQIHIPTMSQITSAFHISYTIIQNKNLYSNVIASSCFFQLEDRLITSKNMDKYIFAKFKYYAIGEDRSRMSRKTREIASPLLLQLCAEKSWMQAYFLQPRPLMYRWCAPKKLQQQLQVHFYE